MIQNTFHNLLLKSFINVSSFTITKNHFTDLFCLTKFKMILYQQNHSNTLVRLDIDRGHISNFTQNHKGDFKFLHVTVVISLLKTKALVLQHECPKHEYFGNNGKDIN